MSVQAQPEHGTYAMALRHRKAGEKPCTPCLIAQREYMREYRAKNGTQRDYDYGLAYRRASERLRALHPAQWQALLAEERDRA